ncbi:MAG TPA: alpha/beta fold hydrolase [Thermoleophilaceae bacterium]|nr:alpha/beta fold hydrolase [Thermoleophilaceae bacterium]
MRFRSALLAALVSGAGLILGSSSASAAVQPAGCSTIFDVPGADCGTLTVPLDRSGAVPGKVKLFFERDRVTGGEKNATIAVFPGGPGAATTVYGGSFLHDFGKRRAKHDLLLLDQRGTGRSGYLNCDVALTPTYFAPPGEDAHTLGKTVERCAKRLGARRGFYTTRETVADLEDVRAALGIDKFILYGISYGTRDAMAYAQAYPEHVERMVLDSSVSETGIDPFGLSSVRALPRVLSQMCRGGGCAGITNDPGADLTTLVKRLESGAVRARQPVTLMGCRLRPAITRTRIYSMLQQVDEDPELLSQLPVALAHAAQGRPFELSTLVASQSDYLNFCALVKILKRLIPQKGIKDDLQLLRTSFSIGEQTARLCEESALPWPRDSIPSQRQNMAERALSGYGDAAFSPLDRATVQAASLIPMCKFWIAANSEPPSGPTPLPAVPTLIVSGLDDLRTPVEDAAALAATSPTARLLRVPDVGHSVIESSGCARRGLGHFLKDEPISECHVYPQHSPKPAKRVPSLQEQLENLLKRLPKPAQ